jgi:tetratricopeptide (TPR) repeat protein
LHWTELDFERLSLTLEHAMLTSRPVANVTLALNHLHAGLNPAPYHWFNLLIHFAVGFALFWVVRVFQRHHGKNDNGAWIALLAVGMYLLHPLNVQAVTYVIQRMTSLSSLFMLLALASYVTGRHRDGRSRVLWFGLTLLFFLLALGSKETAYLLPPLLLLYELCFHHSRWRSWFAQRLSTVPAVLVWTSTGLAVLLTILAVWLQFGSYIYWFETMPWRDFSGYERVLTQGRVQFFYLSLLLLPLPSRLNLDHDFLVSRSLLDPLTTLPALIGILVIIILAIRVIPTRPQVAFPVLAYFLLHSIEAAPINLETVFEHRMYLPMTMLVLLVALNVPRSGTRLAMAGYMITLVVAGLLAVATYQRNQTWGDALVFHNDIAEKSPDEFRPHYNLATILGELGRIDEAKLAIERAISIDPDHSGAHNQLANVYLISHQPRSAERHYRLAVKHDPRNAEALFSLASVLQSQQRFDEQREVLEQFILHAPPYLESQKQWAISYLRRQAITTN